jgi:hypothetical protein
LSKTITGTFLLPSGSPVAFGTLYLKLIQDATVVGTGQIVPATPLAFPLDANGTLGSGVTIFASDELTPSNVAYVLTVAEKGGGQVFGPEFFVINGTSPIDLNGLAPSANSPVVFSQAVILNPTALQTITGFPLAAPGFQSTSGNIASTGFLRLANGDTVKWRNLANSNDIQLGLFGGSGNLPADMVQVAGPSSGFFAPFAVLGVFTSQATGGVLRLNSGDTINWRNNANSADISISKDTNDVIQLGTAGMKTAGATPSVAAGQVGVGNTTGFGTGAAGTAVTTTTKGGGTGPTTPQTVVNYIKINIAGTDFWIPLVQ